MAYGKWKEILLIIKHLPNPKFKKNYSTGTTLQTDIDSHLNENYEYIDFVLPNNVTLSIEKNRFNNDIYGVNRLDNRWELNEIDAIMESIEGKWAINDYVGFIDASVYLFDKHAELPKDIKENLYNYHDERVENAKRNIPQIFFSIKKYKDESTTINYIYVNGVHESPVSIILSLDRFSDNYAIFSDSTTITGDFFPEYPTMYLKFFIKNDDKLTNFEEATLVITSDKRFYVLIDGAFYSLKEID